MKTIFQIVVLCSVVLSSSFLYASGGMEMMETMHKDMKKTTEPYPLKTCVVSGDSLEAMGGGVDYVYDGQLIKFCCKGCIATFEKDPQKYLKKLEEAKAAMASSEDTQMQGDKME